MDPYADHGYRRFRRNSVRLASITSLVAIAMIAAYALSTWDAAPHRFAILALSLLVVVTVAVIELARAERLVETRWCDLFFGTWSTLYVVIIVVFASLDGGAESPLAVTFFPVLVFAGLCYPLWLAIYIGLGCVAAYFALGLFSSGTPLESDLYVAGILALTAVMCSSQALTLERSRRELEEASRSDHLTELMNRRGFYEHAERVLDRAGRAGEGVALVLVDLDGFKSVNDRHGHAAGDELLRWVADRLRAGLRPGDAAARLGGDEFALVLSGIGMTEAGEIAERLRGTLAERVAASFGVSAAAERWHIDALLAEADRALYRDKSRRRSLPGFDALGLELPI